MCRKTGQNQTCEQCGGVFYVPGWRTNVRFCSLECLWLGRNKISTERKRVPRICLTCGQSFEVPPHRSKTANYCSKKCIGSAAGKRLSDSRSRVRLNPETQTKICQICEQEKHFTEFYFRPESADGLRSQCISCWTNINKNREKKPSKIANNREKWKTENKDKIVEWEEKSRTERLEKKRKRRRDEYRKDKPKYVAAARAREKHIKQATPLWANLKAIEAFYIEAARLTLETGIKHHVDHKFPLKSRIMCGLHVETNLQVLPAAVNLRKSNRVLEEEF
jgi:hypothetical protein